MSYTVVAIVLGIINFHQLIFFLFTNGLIGLALGINLFGMVYKQSIIIGVIVIFGIMMIYCWFYDWFAKIIDGKVNQIIKLSFLYKITYELSEKV